MFGRAIAKVNGVVIADATTWQDVEGNIYVRRNRSLQ